MAPQPIKFRCDRCGQLLGVSPSRAGRPVHCPKCGAGLVVPGPPAGPATPPPPSVASMPIAPEAASPALGIFDAIELAPEDLRSLIPADPGPSEPAEVGARFVIEEEDVEGEAAPTPPLPGASEPGSILRGPAVAPVPRSSLPFGSAFEAAPSLGADPADGDAGPTAAVLPRAADGPIVRPRPGRDVVMPRLAFVAWSLFVLMALFLAFIAGLLVGHYVWGGPGWPPGPPE